MTTSLSFASIHVEKLRTLIEACKKRAAERDSRPNYATSPEAHAARLADKILLLIKHATTMDGCTVYVTAEDLHILTGGT